MYLATWWLPLNAKASRGDQTSSLWKDFQNSVLTSLKSHLCKLSLLRKLASLFSSEASHWGGRIVSCLGMTWHHNQRLFLHRVGDQVLSCCLDVAAQYCWDWLTGVAPIWPPWVSVLSGSLSIQSCWKISPESVWAPPLVGLALNQIWSVGLGSLQGLTLFELKSPGNTIPIIHSQGIPGVCNWAQR